MMRTTLEIDDEVLAAAKDLARRRKTSIGAVISSLARAGLIGAAPGKSAEEPPAFYGFRPLPARGRLVSEETVERLRDEQGI